MIKHVTFLIVTMVSTILLSACNKTVQEPISLMDGISINNYYDQASYSAINLEADTEFHRLFNDSIKHEITIEISETEWKGLIRDLVDYNRTFEYEIRNSDYRRAKLIYKDQYGTIEVDDIGFRTRGNTSRVYPQNEDGTFNMSHFKIKFDETFHYGKETKQYKALKGREVFDVEELNLKWNRNHDSTYISELYSYELFHKVGIMSPEASLTKFSIKIGDELTYFGVYTVFEPIDKNFLTKRLGKDHNDGNLYKCLWQQFGQPRLTPNYPDEAIGIKDTSINYRPTYDLKTNKDEANHIALKTFIKEINDLNDDEFKTYIDERFEVDSFLRFLAIGVLTGNPDDYRGLGNNYYLYQKSNNKFEMIPYDYDHSLGQGWGGEPAFSNYSVDTDIYDWGEYHYNHPLSDRILSIPEYQIKYEYYLRRFTEQSNNIFTYDDFFDKYLQQYNLYNHDLPNDLNNAPKFNARNSSWYFNEKIYNVKKQLYYYQEHEEKRGELLGKD